MKTEKEIAQLCKWWASVYEYHQTALNPAQARAYSLDVSQVTIENMESAWRSWRQSNTRAPMPANLLEILRGHTLTIEDHAQFLAAELFRCMTHYAQYGTCYESQATHWIELNLGPQVMKLTQQLGGWKSIWDRSESLAQNPEMTIATWRKALLTILKFDSNDALITKRESQEVLNKASTELKLISITKDLEASPKISLISQGQRVNTESHNQVTTKDFKSNTDDLRKDH